MHWNFTNDDQSVTVNLSENSSNNAVWGTVTYMGKEYPVTGMWQASGSVSGRVTSNLQLSGRYDTALSVPDFIALSGLIRGSHPNMGPMDVMVHTASSSTGDLYQAQANLATNPGQPVPAAVDPMPGGGTNTPWMLSSLDGRTVMKVQVGEHGAVNGTLTVGNDFSVGGQWAFSEWAPGRNATAFELMGRYATVEHPGASNLMAVAGIVTGPYQFPQKIEVSGSIASISEWQNTPFSGTLLPMAQTDSAALGAAYAESYMVIQMGGTHGDSQAVKGWTGPVDGNGFVSAFGSSDYQSAGTEMNAGQLAAIASSDPTYPDTNDIKIPAFSSAAGTRPVMIQFIGDAGHFPQPPLQEYHSDVTKIFYDEQVGALVLQFADTPAGTASTQINFNQGRAKNHNSVIIEPY